jgi:hypothetical protein
MERREFLKLSALFAAGVVLSKIGAHALTSNSIIIYKAINEKGEIIVGATRYSKPSAAWNVKVDANSFQILETLSESSLVSSRKMYWMQKFNIEIINKRYLSFSPGAVKGGRNAGRKNKDSGKMKLVASAGGKIGGPKTIHIRRQKYLDALQDPIRGKEIREIHSHTLKEIRNTEDFKMRLAEVHANSEAKKKSELKNIKKATEKTYEQVECPHCSKFGAARIMKRWHFQNCTKKPA